MWSKFLTYATLGLVAFAFLKLFLGPLWNRQHGAQAGDASDDDDDSGVTLVNGATGLPLIDGFDCLGNGPGMDVTGFSGSDHTSTSDD